MNRDPEPLKVIVAGRGGQGVILLTRLLAHAAVSRGRSVIISETHGMSQRGGAVICHLKIDDSLAPLIRRGTADLLLATDTHEAVRNLPFLRPGGSVMVNAEDDFPPAVQQILPHSSIAVLRVPATRMAAALDSAAVANVILAGFAAAHPTPGLAEEALRDAVEALAHRNKELNVRAFVAGLAAGRKIEKFADVHI